MDLAAQTRSPSRLVFSKLLVFTNRFVKGCDQHLFEHRFSPSPSVEKLPWKHSVGHAYRTRDLSIESLPRQRLCREENFFERLYMRPESRAAHGVSRRIR